MAIKGLTDRDARWPRLGTLRKGARGQEKTNRDGKKYKSVGSDLGERFRFDGIDPATQTQWQRIFGGDEVDELEILLPYEDLAACWDAWREEWKASSLVRRCDGETIIAWRDDSGGYSHEPKPCPKRANGSCACNTKPTGRLTFTVPAFARMGTITLTTTSVHDIMAIDGTLKQLAATVGDLRLVPLRLSRVERQISMPTDDGGRRRVTKWLVNLEAHPDWVERQLAHQKSLALSAASDFTALPAPEEDEDPPLLVDHETGEVIEAQVGETPAQQTAEPEHEPKFTDRIEQTATTLEALIIADEIVDRLPQNAHRCNALGKAFMRAVELARTEDDIKDIRGAFAHHHEGLGKHKQPVVDAATYALADIQAKAQPAGDAEPAAMPETAQVEMQPA